MNKIFAAYKKIAKGIDNFRLIVYNISIKYVYWQNCLCLNI